jgi:hypothetical protein
MAKIKVQTTEISIILFNENDFISLTDISSGFKEGSGLISKWITNKNTLEYLSIWERIHNVNFNYPEFGVIEKDSGVNRFTMSVGQWISRTAAKGLTVKSGRYGGTYAHKDIAFHFAMWLSPEFQIYLIQEFQRLKHQEYKDLGWSVKRELAKVNYHIHTQAIKDFIVPKLLSKDQVNTIYANEADLLNVALFGITAREWRDCNPSLQGNIRDYASMNELICLSNLENINSLLIQEKLEQKERLFKLNQLAIQQMTVLQNLKSRDLLR